MNTKIRDGLFLLMCFSLIFNCLPKPITMGFIGGPLGSHLMFYPFFVGLLYTLWCQYKYKNVFVNFNKFSKYVGVYLIIVLVSLLLGLYNYPYYDQILSGPVEQVEKIPKLLVLFEKFRIDISAKQLLSFWMFARPIKALLFEVLYTFGFLYVIYCWYHNEWKRAVDVLTKGVLGSLTICITYSVVEIFYLSGNGTAKSILENITPYIHSIKSNGTWWPPLLWNGQLRSVFAEPSYFGIYSAFCLPFLWLGIIRNEFGKKCQYIYVIVSIGLAFLVFLTKARAAFMLYIGELFIFLLILIYLRNKDLLMKATLILLCNAIVFIGSNLFVVNYMTDKRMESKSLQSAVINYVDSNAVSLVKPDARSNRARYSVMEADIKVGLEHPLLGVGRGLRSAYVIDAFSEKALQNNEIKMWLDFNKRLGILKFGIPTLGEYTSRFSETGVLGLLVFLFPPIFLAFNMLRKLKVLQQEVLVINVIYLTSLAGIMASGIGDSINITYCYWVLLGVGYAMCFGKEGYIRDDK